MEIISYFEKGEPESIASQIRNSDWSGAASLSRLLDSGTFFEKLGKKSRLLVLMDEGQMAAFCTLAEKDDVPDTELTPWIGYVFTDPKYRGKGCAPELIEFAEKQALEDGYENIYISTGHEGLYEKYGYDFYGFLKNKHNQDSRIYQKKLHKEN